MRFSFVIAAASSAALVASFTGTATAQPPEAASAGGSGGTAGSWIVVLADETAPGRVSDAHARRYGVRVDHLYRHALKGYSARMSATAAARIADDPRVASVQPDRVVSIAAPGGNAKPDNGNGGGKPPKDEPTTSPEESTQTTPTGIRRVNADDSTTKAGAGSGTVDVDVDVAVIDTGIDRDHPDLNVVGGVNCSTGPSHKYDDGNGHGTHVAGTIGAKDDAHGVVGVAPGARLWAVRVLDNTGSGAWSSVVCGIDWVTANADVIDVANMSLGGGGKDDGSCGNSNNDAMHQAICESVNGQEADENGVGFRPGVTYVVAAGNSSADASTSVPAAYDEVITVSALADFDGESGGLAEGPYCRDDVDDTFANFSNFGQDVDLIAPGVCIESTWKGGGYDTISGTSMAAPHVAGGAALHLAANPTATPAQVQSALESVGSPDWIHNTEDPDGIKEPLLDVTGY